MKIIFICLFVVFVALTIVYSIFSNGRVTDAENGELIPCGKRQARKYAEALEAFIPKEQAKLPERSGRQLERSHWLIAKAQFAVLLANRKTNGLEAPITQLMIEDIYTAVMKGCKENDQNADKMTEEAHTARLRSYLSEIDGTRQTYSISVPEVYDPAVKWPLIVSLHGHGWFSEFQGHPAPSYKGAFCLSPQGRGASDYRDLGELDVLKTIDLVMEEFNIDPDRVYLTGSSMGGTGAFFIGAHYADRFAGIFSIVGNADNQAWTKRWGWNADFPGRNAALRDAVQEIHTARAFAPNLLNLPVYVLAGSGDIVVPPEHSRLMVDALREVGANCEYREYPDAGHGGFSKDATDAGLAWVCGKKRNQFPTHIIWRTALLKHGQAYWTKIVQLAEPLRIGQIDVEAVDRQSIYVKTDGVSAFAIRPPEKLFDITQELAVMVDDVPLKVPSGVVAGQWVGFRKHPGTGQWMNSQDVEVPEHEKTVGAEGPVHEALMAPFIVVVGTASEMSQVWQDEARSFAWHWKERYGAEPRVLKDSELTQEQIEQYNLILLGGSGDNLISARILPQTPFSDIMSLVQFRHATGSGESVTSRPDVGSFIVYPRWDGEEPRLSVIVHADSPAAAYQVWGRFGNWFNWGVYDSKKYFDFAVYDSKSCSPETMLLVGWFGQDWSMAHAKYYFGDDGVRQATALQGYPEKIADDAEVRLSEVKPDFVHQMRGAAGFGRSFFGEALETTNSIGVRAPATIQYTLKRPYKTFTADVELLNSRECTLCMLREKGEKVTFYAYDGEKELASVTVSWKEPRGKLTANVEGVQELTLVVKPTGGPSWLHNGAAWLNPVLK